ncbi:MAG TPA: hypothetical protein VGD98_20685 [Ktedonobacteraceae bacterium]
MCNLATSEGEFPCDFMVLARAIKIPYPRRSASSRRGARLEAWLPG